MKKLFYNNTTKSITKSYGLVYFFNITLSVYTKKVINTLISDSVI